MLVEPFDFQVTWSKVKVNLLVLILNVVYSWSYMTLSLLVILRMSLLVILRKSQIMNQGQNINCKLEKCSFQNSLLILPWNQAYDSGI